MELERRFLVQDKAKFEDLSGDTIMQGYLFVDGGFAIRVRRRMSDSEERQAMLTLKGPRTGEAREEYEMPIDSALAAELYRRSPWKVLKKRYSVVEGNDLWDVDRFLGENSGLWIAECEYEVAGYKLDIPAWCGAEITGERRFNNEELAMKPQPNIGFQRDH
jgi:CYTH domain-containing protein